MKRTGVFSDVTVYSKSDPDESNLSVCCTADGKYFATSSTRGHVAIRPMDSTTTHARPATLSGGFGVTRNGSATAVKFSDEPPTDEGYMCAAASSDGTLGLWRVDPGKTVSPKATASEGENEIMSLAFVPNSASRRLASGGSDSVIRLYDVVDGELSLTRRIERGISQHGQPTWGPPAKVMSLLFIDENVIVAAGWETSALLYDLRIKASVEPTKLFPGASICGDGLHFTNNTLLTVSHRSKDQVQLFHLSGAEIERHTVDFLPLSGRLAFTKAVVKPNVWLVGTQSPTLALLDTVKGSLVGSLTELDGPLFSVDVSPVDPSIAAAVGAHDTAMRIAA